MHRLGVIPGRGVQAERFYLRPDQQAMLPVETPGRWSDYQLCYWHCLETRMRQTRDAARLAEAGLPVAWIDNAALSDPAAVAAMLQGIGIPERDIDHTALETACREKANTKSRKIRNAPLPEEEAARQEAEVRAHYPDHSPPGRLTLCGDAGADETEPRSFLSQGIRQVVHDH